MNINYFIYSSVLIFTFVNSYRFNFSDKIDDLVPKKNGTKPLPLIIWHGMGLLYNTIGYAYIDVTL